MIGRTVCLAALASLMAIASQRIVLFEDTIEVPPEGWSSQTVALRQTPGAIDCIFTVMSSGPGIRAVLVQSAGQQQHWLAATLFRQAGRLRYRARTGEYSVRLEQLPGSREPVEVNVQLALEFGAGMPEPEVLSPARRAAVIVTSLLVFFAVLFFAGRKLLRAVSQRPGGY